MVNSIFIAIHHNVQTLYIYIQELVVFLVKPEVVDLRVSKNKSKSIIDCIVKAYPTPKISWKQCNVNGTNCRDLKKNTMKKEVGIGKYKSTISLNISALYIYTCEATNAHGNDTKSTPPDSTVTDHITSEQNQGASLFIIYFPSIRQL